MWNYSNRSIFAAIYPFFSTFFKIFAPFMKNYLHSTHVAVLSGPCVWVNEPPDSRHKYEYRLDVTRRFCPLPPSHFSCLGLELPPTLASAGRPQNPSGGLEPYSSLMVECSADFHCYFVVSSSLFHLLPSSN